MDRKSQLRNVAFGGAWSEQIAGREALVSALDLMASSELRILEEDLRLDSDLAEALQLLCETHPKGPGLSRAWDRALGQGLGSTRARELRRIYELLRGGILDRISG